MQSPTLTIPPRPRQALLRHAAGGFGLGSTARRSGAMMSGGLPSVGLATPPAALGFAVGPLGLGGFGPGLFPFVGLWLVAFGGALGAYAGAVSTDSQIVGKRSRRLPARRVVLAQEAFYSK